MNVFILDRSMEKSAQMLDDAHLIAQINEATQILMANYNRKRFPSAKIDHANHPVTVYYNTVDAEFELLSYLRRLNKEYEYRFVKRHQSYIFMIGLSEVYYFNWVSIFQNAKTLVNGSMTDDIEAIRKYISTKPHVRALKWTNRERPDWWEV